MTKVTLRADCGNSPKNILLKDVTIALALGDPELIKQATTEDIRWRVAGKDEMTGRASFLQTLERLLPPGSLDELAIDHVVSHGKAGAVDGWWSKAGHVTAFCHVYEFGNAKGTDVKTIISYLIDLA